MQSSSSPSRPINALILVSALITAAVHLFLGVRDVSTPFGIAFILNAIGYAGLTGLYLLPIGFLVPFRPVVRWVLLGFTVLTFILYFVFNGLQIDAVSGITKAAELALIGLLLTNRSQK
jgi:hypothetical protein